MITNDTILLIGVIASLTLTFFIGIGALNSFCKSSDITHESQAVELHGREQELPDDATGKTLLLNGDVSLENAFKSTIASAEAISKNVARRIHPEPDNISELTPVEPFEDTDRL